MSHELTIRANGSVEMAFAGEGCWHGLGNKLAVGADLEAWRIAAGMDWKVQRSKVRFATGHGQGADAWGVDESNHVLLRSDTKAPLGIVSNKFKVVQPGQVLEFFRDLTETAGFQMETAGTLFGGRRFWALARIGKDAAISNVDRVGGFLLLSTACDGTMATTAQFTTVRVVCNNTLSMALSRKSKAGSVIRVTHRSEFDAEAVKAELGVGRGQFVQFMDAASDLAGKRITQGEAHELTIRLLAGKKLEAAKTPEATRVLVDEVTGGKGFKAIMGLFNGSGLGSDLVTAKGTAWGWVNAVTQFVDYAAPARNQDNRMNSALFGDGDDRKTEALELALAV